METQKEIVYKYISEDQELNNFFKKLTLCCNNTISEKMSKNSKPNLDKVSAAIKKVEETGLILNETRKNELLYEYNYKTINFLLNFDGFKYQCFNGYEIADSDIEVFKQRIENIKNGLNDECLTISEKKYREWKLNNDYISIESEYEKANRKYIKKMKNGSKTIKKSKYLKNLEGIIAVEQRFSTEAEFFKNLTYEQMEAIIELQKQLNETQDQYHEYYLINKIEKDYVDNNKFFICAEALKKMLDQSLVEIDINNIIKKILVINMVIQNNPIKEEITQKEYDFDIEVVDSFINLQKKELENLQQKVFNINNFTLAVNTVCEKVLKK